MSFCLFLLFFLFTQLNKKVLFPPRRIFLKRLFKVGLVVYVDGDLPVIKAGGADSRSALT